MLTPSEKTSEESLRAFEDMGIVPVRSKVDGRLLIGDKIASMSKPSELAFAAGDAIRPGCEPSGYHTLANVVGSRFTRGQANILMRWREAFERRLRADLKQREEFKEYLRDTARWAYTRRNTFAMRGK